MTNYPQPVIVKGACVGTTDNGVFRKRVDSRYHFLRVPPAIALDLHIFEDMERHQTDDTVAILDTFSRNQYWATVAMIRKQGVIIDRGHGKQIALALGCWMATESGARYCEKTI